MKYLVAGRIYSDYKLAIDYANFLARISRIIFAVEAVTDDFEEQMRSMLYTLKHPPASPD